MEIPPKTIQIDSKQFVVAEAPGGSPVWDVQSGQRLEKEFTFGGAMGETRCVHQGPCDGYFFAEGFDVTDGTARLHPLITTVGTRYTGTFDGAGGGGGTVLTDADGGFPTSGDGLKGYTVTITGGTGSGGARTISSNTATTVTVASITIDATSTYDISVLGTLAYTPLTFFEDFDSTSTRAVYCVFRDCTTTPDIIAKKIRPSDDTPNDTKIFGVAVFTAPRIGSTKVFAGATYVPMGDTTGSRLMQKLATVGAIASETTDIWQDADATIYAYACGSVTAGGTIKFMRGNAGRIDLTSAEPKTAASYEGERNVGDSGDPVMWITEMSDGLIAIHKGTNLYLWDSDGNTYPVLPGTRQTSRDITASETVASNTYDDYEGHMGASLSAGVLHPSGSGLWFYENGRIRNVSIDQIGQGTQNPYRRVPNISNIPFGNRHYATVVFGQWIYSIYKPTGFSNSANVHIMCGYYQGGEITWRTLLTDSKDIIGLFIDSGMRLWWISDPQDPATVPGTPTADLKYITLNADGSPRTVLAANRGTASTTYTYYFPEIDFDLPYVQKQLRLMTLETENLPTAGVAGVTIQLGVHRDGGAATTVGATITTAGTTVTDREPTVGTTDTGYRLRPYLTLVTGADYAPASSDPRLMRLKIEARSADVIRTVILPSQQRNLFETKKTLRKLKSAGAKTVREPETNETFSANIIAVNDAIHNNQQAVEIILERWSVNA